MVKVGRNELCPCGSGKKYKNCCLELKIDDEKLQMLFDSLLSISKSLKTVPPVLINENIKWLPILTPEYFIFSILSLNEFDRAKNLISKRLNPFPGLITTYKNNAAFKLDKSQKSLISGCSVNNMYSISLGQDSSIAIINHSQEINIVELGLYKYFVELAYIISFGDEINRSNMYDYITELVNYSVDNWRVIDGK